MLSPSLATVRLFLHVVAACIWVGGQLVLGALVGGLRPHGPEVVRAAARRFNRIAWPAFAVAVLSGIWTLTAVDVGNTSTAYQTTLGLKLALVTLSGLAAAAHVLAQSKLALALGGAMALLTGLGAVFLGVLLRS